MLENRRHTQKKRGTGSEGVTVKVLFKGLPPGRGDDVTQFEFVVVVPINSLRPSVDRSRAKQFISPEQE